MASELMNRITERARQMKAEREEAGWDPRRSDAYNRIVQNIRNGGFLTSITDAEAKQYFEDVKSCIQDTGQKLTSGSWSDVMDPSNDWKRQNRSFTDKGHLIRQWAGAQRQSRGDEWFNSVTSYLDELDQARKSLNQDFLNFQNYYSNWDSQQAYDEYIEYINSDKYQDDLILSGYMQMFENMSKTEMDAVIVGLPDGDVKTQLQNYRKNVLRNTDDYLQEIGERKWEIGRLQDAYDRLEFLSTQPALVDGADISYYEDVYGAKAEDSPELKALKEEYELYQKNYGSTGEISKRLVNLEVERYNLEKGMKYDLLYQNADFAEKSKYNGEGSNTQRLVNNPDAADTVDTVKTVAGLPFEPTAFTIAKLADAFGYENLHLMEDRERQIYNYLYNTQGEGEADDYLDWLQPTLNARSQQNSMEWVAERTRDVPGLSQIYTSLLSTPLKFMSGEALLDVAGQKVYNYVTDSDRPIDYNRDAFFFANAGNTIRSTVAQDINTATGGPIELDVDEHPFLASILNGKGVGDIYSLAMSAQDSSVVAAATAINPVAGMVANAMLSTSAATDAMVSAANNGATDGQAFTVGLAAGFFEYFFEKYEVGSLMKQGKNVVTATLKQALSEALGEGATELSNLVVNTYVLAENSDYEKNIEKYLLEHPDWTEERARKQAFLDAIGQVLSASAGGFVSGGAMGSAYTGIQNVGDNIYTKRADTGIAEGLLQSDGGMNRLKELAMEVAEENESKRLEKNIERFDKNPTVKNTRKLYRSVADSYAIQDQGDVVKSLKRKGFSDSEASTLASALIAESTGTAVEEDGAKLLQKYIGDSRIQETRKQILENTKSSVAQRQDKLDGLQYESALGAIKTELKKTKTRTDMTETASKRFAELGETTADIDALAEAAAKSAAGEKLTSAEKKLLKGSEYSTQVVQELKEATAKPVAEATAAETPTPDTTSTSTETTAPAETTTPETATEVSTDGVTIQKSTGNAVQIKEVASIKNGKMTLRLEDGSEVDASDISYGSEAEAMVYETVARLGTHAKAANLLISAFKTGDVPALNYSKGIMEAHEYGKYNFSEEDMMRRGSFVKDLTPYQRSVAYQVGQIFGGREVAKEHAAVRRPKNSETSLKEGKVHFDGDRSKLNDTQKASFDALEMLSKALGIQIYIFESKTDADGKRTNKNGWYDLGDGSIHIDLNAGLDGKGTMLFTAAHELTHFIRQWSPAKFKVLANFLIGQYHEKGVSVKELVDKQIAKAKRDGRTIDRDTAYEEVIADSMETMLTDGNVLQQLAELRQRDKTLWEKIRGWFKDFANKLKAVIKTYDGVKPDSVEGRLVSDMKGVVEILESLYVDALMDASANYAAGAQKNTAGGGVKYSIVALDDGRVYVKASRNIITGSTKSDQRRNITDFFNSLLDGQPSLDIYTIEGDILTISKAQTAKKARDDYKSVGGTPVKMTDSEFAVKMRIEAHIDEIAEVSRSSNQKSDTKNHAFAQSGFTYRRAYFEDFDGQYYEITLSIGKNGSIATVYNVGKIDKSVPPSAKIIAVVGSKALGGTLSKNSIRNSSGIVKEKSSTRDHATEKLQQALEKENARLKEDITYLKELLALQRKVTGGTKFTKSSVTAAAQMLKKNANAKGDTKELATLLNTFYEYIATEKELTWEGVKEQAQAPVQWLQDHVNLKPQRSEYAREVLQQIRGSRIYLDESQKAEAAHRFGSFNDFRKSIMGNVTIVKDGNTSLDSFWQEMSATYPDIFNSETASGDMPGELFDIIGSLRNSDTSRVEYEYNRDSITMDLLQQVYDSYWRVSNLRTATDSAQKKINVLRFKHNEQMSKLRAEKNAKIDSLKVEYRAELDKVRKEHRADTEAKVQAIRDKYTSARERAVEGRKRTEVKHKIQKVVKELNDLLLKEDKKRHVPDSMKKAVAAALDFIQLDTVNAEERIAKYDALIAEATDPDVIDSLMVTRQNLVDKGEKIGDRLKELHEAYADIMASDDPDISSGVDPVIDGNLRELRATIGDTPFSKLSMEQLEDVYSMYKMVLTRIRDANKSFLSDQNKSISDRATSDIRQVRAVGGEHKFLKDNKRRQFWWNNLKPVYAIEKIGGGELKKAFWQLIKGEGTYALDTSGARDFAEDMQQKHKYNSWDMKKQYSFTSTSGVEFSLNLEQIMSLYAFSRRDQALDHLRIGGFVFDSSIVLDSIEEKNPKTGKAVKKKGRWIVNSADAHQISADILGDIISVLDADQIAFVDAMQGYLSDTMGAKGNDVSMAMYGIKLFKEKHYFPLKTASSYMFQQNEVSGEVKLKNAGFTQKTTPRANNPIILRNFMDVWADHVHDMSMYHSFTLAIEDFNRIFNYTSPRVEGTTPDSLRRTIQNAYGSEAVKYLRDMIVDLNGGVRSDSREATFKKLMSRWKKSSVAGSLSVAIQQPSALLRAKALVDDRYFITVNPKLLSSGALWKELRTYAPIAIIKEMGRFDMDTGVGTIDYIKGTKKTFMDHVDKVTGFLPEKADQWAWAQIWVAVKKEVAAKQPDLSGKAYFEACGDRFTEVIVKTQVYDSTLSRSANMRSKSAFMQMATAFMAEPTTAINMIEDAIRQYRRGYKQQAKKTIRAVIDSTIANAILVSLIYALRDDDEDETFAEKYAGALTQELIDGFNPLTYFPLTKDVWSIFQGYDVERSDMSLIADLANTVKKIGRKMIKDTGSMDETEVQDHYREATGIAWDLVSTVANCFGIPVKNISRDVEACINGVKTFRKGPSNNTRSFWNKVGDAVQETIPFMDLWNDSSSDDLYEAIIADDANYVTRVKNKYLGKETAYTTALRKALRENDPRIQDAAKARQSMDTAEYLRIVEEIVAEGYFSKDDVVAAVRSEYNSMKGDDVSTQLYNAMAAGDDETAAELKGSFVNDEGQFSKESYQNAIRKGLRENDPRIKEAAEAKVSGDMDRYFEIIEEIVEEGYFKWKDVSAAAKSEAKELEEG